ncbi:HAMP domain-containing histidine kinase [Vibrio sp. S4M6]|uniref:sensor histidine kinase n=1 Tax=Vibrio sinus TaxID=2946865 RepID=UPI00202A22BE|nr:HAMP domain-containing sensor histidine kinase [Vibrio sinus]MCL9780184.1 HAMP domain-containing histidine kinase [Vibrio sinus]
MDMLVIFKIYLLYGLMFFAIFFAILFRNLAYSQIRLASALPIFAAFGLIHAIHEWSELYLLIYQHEFFPSPALTLFKLLKLWLSYIVLGIFAWKLVALTSWRYKAWVRTLVIAVLTLFVVNIILRYSDESFTFFVHHTEIQIRLIFSFGASLLAGCALYNYAISLEFDGHGSSIPFKLTGLALITYGVSSGIFTTELGLWVLTLRVFSAAALLVTLWYALRIFDDERDKQLQGALNQSLQDAKLKELGELTSAVAHEIKTPISSAMMSCDLLANQVPENEDCLRQLDRIRYGLSRAAEISQEVLSYAHHKPLQRKPVYLHAIIESSLSLNQYRLTDFHVDLDVDRDLIILGDEGLLEQVVSNLIANSIDASTSKKYLRVEGHQDKLNATVRVVDHAGGLPISLIDKATQPFFTTKPKGEGTGMGLAIAKQIILQHNGTFTLSNSEGGLTVEIQIPREI